VTVSFNIPITDIVPICDARDLFRPESETVTHGSWVTTIIDTANPGSNPSEDSEVWQERKSGNTDIPSAWYT